ncbi:MAG: hypothetical protein LBG19_01140 [Prevotellaceae bacterium]|jgi:hypothetical protein|nr:hypothetical protein [Prevotellaceae bacterium]
MKKSKYIEQERAYAVSIVARFNGSYEAAASYLKEEGKITVTGKTLKNWRNDVTLPALAEPVQDALLAAAEVGCLAEVSDDVILSNATKGLNAVVDRLNERLSDDRYTKRITNNELVNIGNFFASLKELDKDKQTNSSGTTNIYQQIINQHYHAKGH